MSVRPAIRRPEQPLLYDAFGKPMALHGAWAGTRNNRNLQRKWDRGIPGSADEDLLDDLPTLRGRARQSGRDNPLGAGAVNINTKHVVGTGLSLRPEVDREVLAWDETKATTWQDTTGRLFDMWCRSTACDATLTQNFWEMQDLAYRSAADSGDVLAVFGYRKVPFSPWGTCVRLVEADRISNKDLILDTPTLCGGVQLDSFGAAVGYWVQDQHPGSRLSFGRKGTWTYYPAYGKNGFKRCQHLFIRMRPDQHRGFPYLSTVLEALKDLGEYTDGELRAAVVSGLYTVAVTSPAALDENGTPIPPAEGTDELDLGYGASLVLEPGEKLEQVTPGRPNQAFDPFVLAVLRQIGAALEIPFEILVQHFTASYSAARAALLELAKFVRRRRAWLAANFCQPIYEAWLEEAVSTGHVQAPGFFDDPLLRMAYCGAQWDGDSLGVLDPVKEVNAYKIAVGETFATKEQATAELFGGDYRRNVERRGREIQAEKDSGITPPPVPGAGAIQSAQPAADPAMGQPPAKPKKEAP